MRTPTGWLRVGGYRRLRVGGCAGERQHVPPEPVRQLLASGTRLASARKPTVTFPVQLNPLTLIATLPERGAQTSTPRSGASVSENGRRAARACW
jgi:hypothetical protein